jgi:hypothetical protein
MMRLIDEQHQAPAMTVLQGVLKLPEHGGRLGRRTVEATFATQQLQKLFIGELGIHHRHGVDVQLLEALLQGPQDSGFTKSRSANNG